MKMELIQPFISAADAILASSLDAPAQMGDLSMEEDDYRQKGYAARVSIRGDIEGRVIVDMSTETALRLASALSGCELKTVDQTIKETIHELANMIIGNAITLLNDHGYKFKVFPPEENTGGDHFCDKSETEQLAVFFDTNCGRIFLNVRMRYNLCNRVQDLSPQPVA